MRKHKYLFAAAGFLLLLAISALFFTETFSSDFTLFMGFGLLPFSIAMFIGFLISWLFDVYGKGRKKPAAVIILFCSVIAAIAITAIGLWDLTYSNTEFFPGLFGIILLIFALPPLIVAAIVALVWIIIRKSKIKIKENEDTNV